MDFFINGAIYVLGLGLIEWCIIYNFQKFFKQILEMFFLHVYSFFLTVSF